MVDSPTTASKSRTAYYAAILYDNRIPIWVAGGSTSPNGGATDSSATLQLFPNGNLVLLSNNPSGAVVWQSRTADLSISAASLDDSGNFLLKTATGSKVWSTFENPTDTIVPLQNFTSNNTLRSGIYSFELLNDGNLTLKWNDSIEYFNLAPKLNSNYRGNITLPSVSIQPIGILQISSPRLPNPLPLVYSSDYGEGGDILRFIKLDNDGNLRIYSSRKQSGTKVERWSAVGEQCEVFGYYGNNGICSYDNNRPVCGCASLNFEFVDPGDRRKGCKRKVEISDCPGNETMLELDHGKFLTYFPETDSQVYSVGISACRGNCLMNPTCVASTTLSDGSGFCYLKLNDRTKFLSGYQSPALTSISYMKVCQPIMQNPSAGSSDAEEKDRRRLKAWIIVVIVLGTILALIALVSGLCWSCFRNSPKFGRMSAQNALFEYASSAPVLFSYKELQRATKGFKEKLGAGGFGVVYGGILANRSVVAVKQLEGIAQGEKQFRMEVATISSTHHLNLVRLIGFCSQGRHRLLVYEFMKNGSLDNFLFVQEQSSKHLNWGCRYNIAVGAARGIAYLHEECRDCIVHCDIKPENILLDNNYSAKVSDFGLAKLVNPKDHRYCTLTSVKGTRGYLAPEWRANLPITSKSDVYSFGMVLLEIVSGKRNFEVSAETNQKAFSVWAYEEFDRGNAEAIVDKRLTTHDVDMEQVTRAIQVSFWCIQEQPSERPVMGKVVQMLEGIIEIERPPAPKAMTEASLGGSNVDAGRINALSTFAASVLAPSSVTPIHTAGVSSTSSSGKNVERASSLLLKSEGN